MKSWFFVEFFLTKHIPALFLSEVGNEISGVLSEGREHHYLQKSFNWVSKTEEHRIENLLL